MALEPRQEDNRNVVVFVGGVGGAKLAHGLAQILPPERLTVIVNTGDDFWHYGLRICPDLDTVTYTLAGVVDPANGWGLRGDTTAMLDALRRFGEQPWFRLGDQDLATHLLRTLALRDGQRMTDISARLTKSLGIAHTVLPMTDDPVATMIQTIEQGELDFQEYFVRYRWQPTVKAIRYAGAEAAQVTPEVQKALLDADVILFGPSNPWLSIEPILSVTGMRALIAGRPVPRVALTPIVEGQALKGPAAKIAAELGYEVSPQTVANAYRGVINGFVYDVRDAGGPFDILHEFSDMRTSSCDTIMLDEASRARVARVILDWTANWEADHEHMGDHPR
ncbi:MAG: 2-phospho-L-lactate transferase [Chloroflexi bacterium]|nr:2-phospho-L-lactate transferase [Chloroflexota bacterium]